MAVIATSSTKTDISLTGTLARCSDLVGDWSARVGCPLEPGWSSYAELLDDRAISRRLRELTDHYQGPTAMAAQFLVGWIASAVTVVPVASLVAERRLPLLDPTGLWLRAAADEEDPGGPEWYDAMALGRARMAVLPGDPAVGLVNVQVVSDLAALQALLVEQTRQLLTPLVGLVHRVTRRGRRALWGAVADDLTLGFMLAGEALNEPERTRAEAGATFAPAQRPLDFAPDWLRLEHGGRLHLRRRKTVCCLAYRAPRWGYCATCPLIPRAETELRLLAHLDDEGAA